MKSDAKDYMCGEDSAAEKEFPKAAAVFKDQVSSYM